MSLPVSLPESTFVHLRFGVLHSNRSLLLMNQIQSNDEEVLQFGSHAAWTLVVKDAWWNHRLFDDYIVNESYIWHISIGKSLVNAHICPHLPTIPQLPD